MFVKSNKLIFVLFENYMVVPPVVEKLVGLILYKIFNRVKQFIENVRI